ncbi:S1 family peptidase [Allorhizocola rhizosphaerae]|uniref:S1 family peptidase n=1 Tax=Allorhizocola rhizosphaerae TaxID=1872709 RepID=UPI0013C37056|nr:S1 family peptidase [Allorhizocola rhizosphaerae]
MNRRHLRHVQITLGVAIIFAGLLAVPATAAEEAKKDTDSAPVEAPPAGFRSWEELSELQDRLNNAADHILSERSEGYSGLVAAPENRELLVYWKGEVPAEVKERAARAGVPVSFAGARYSQVELNEEVLRLGADKRVGEAAPNVDGSGVTVTVSNDADAEAVRGEARLPLTVNLEQRPELLWNRQNDISPYWGGARWTNLSTGGQCSTGFSVIAGGQPRMVSAAHCANVSNVVRIGNATQPTTSVVADINPRDHLLINRPPNRTFAGRIYTGGWASMSSTPVVGATSDYVGNWICTSGATSGERCNARVVAVNTSVLGMSPMIRAEKVPFNTNPNNCIAAPGDSGGPVFSWAINLSWFKWGARARGTVTAGILNTPCSTAFGWIWGSNTVWYAPAIRPWGDAQIGFLTWYAANLM